MSAVAVADATALASGKGHDDENFPVASWILKPRYRAPIMAFYQFARAADDVADNAAASAVEKLALLGAMRATLSGDSDANPEALALRRVCAERKLTPQHGLDLLTAFERDCTVSRYATWNDLIDYCRVSAMPVGRYVLDVHGESRELWPANDALCAALQVINHLQDCGKDYRNIDRVYLPTEMLAAAGASVEELGRDRATSALRGVIVDLTRMTQGLLAKSACFAGCIHDRRLAVEVAVIQRLAESLCAKLMARDPLSERVHHTKLETLLIAGSAGLGRMLSR